MNVDMVFINETGQRFLFLKWNVSQTVPHCAASAIFYKSGRTYQVMIAPRDYVEMLISVSREIYFNLLASLEELEF